MKTFILKEFQNTQVSTYDKDCDCYPILTGSGFSLVKGPDYLVQLILSALYTPKGSIFYDRKSGTVFRNTIFEPMDDITMEALIESAKEDIKYSVPIADFTLEQVTVDNFNKTVTFNIKVKYKGKEYANTHTFDVYHIIR